MGHRRGDQRRHRPADRPNERAADSRMAWRSPGEMPGWPSGVRIGIVQSVDYATAGCGTSARTMVRVQRRETFLTGMSISAAPDQKPYTPISFPHRKISLPHVLPARHPRRSARVGRGPGCPRLAPIIRSYPTEAGVRQTERDPELRREPPLRDPLIAVQGP